MENIELEIPERITVNGYELLYTDCKTSLDKMQYIELCMKLGCSVLRYPNCELVC